MAVDGSDLEDYFKLVRDNVNSGISVNDVAGANEDALALGQGNLYQKSWYGLQGFVLYDFDNGENRGNWSWSTALTKTANRSVGGGSPDPHTEYAVLIQEQYFDVAGCSKRFYVPQASIVHVQVTADILSPKINEWGVSYRMTNYEGRTASKAYLFVDGSKKTHSLGYSFEERVGSPPTGEAGTFLTSSSNDPSTLWNRRYYSCFYDVYLSEGWHEVKLKIDCRNERTYVARRGIYLEGWYQ